MAYFMENTILFGKYWLSSIVIVKEGPGPMDDETVHFERRNGVAVLMLTCPEATDSIDEAMRLESPLALDAARDDPEITPLVLTGTSGDSSVEHQPETGGRNAVP